MAAAGDDHGKSQKGFRQAHTWAQIAEARRQDWARPEPSPMSQFRLKPTEPTEGQFHTTVAQFLDWALIPPALYTTFPSGWGVLARSTAGRLKGAGLKSGMPDILLFHDGRCFGIELKAWNGKISEAQKDMHTKLRAAGTVVFVCSTLDEVVWCLNKIGCPLRRTKGATDERRQQQPKPVRGSVQGSSAGQ